MENPLVTIYYSSLVLCPVCYYNNIIAVSKSKSIMIVIFLVNVFFVIGSILFFVAFGVTGFVFAVPTFLTAGTFDFVVFFWFPKMAKEAELKKSKFLTQIKVSDQKTAK